MNEKQLMGLKKGPGLWVVGAAAAILIAGVLIFMWTAKWAERMLRADLLTQAREVAPTLNIKRIQMLSGTEQDLNSPDYLLLKKQLDGIRKANTKYRFVYLMGRKADGTVFFFVDSEPADSKDYSPPGQVYEEVPEGSRHAFNTKTEAVEGPVTDRWGVWISALVPIIDLETGDLVAVLGIDTDAGDWKWNVAARAALPVGLMLLLFIGMGAALIAARRTVAQPKPVLRRLLLPIAVIVILLMGGAGALLWQQQKKGLEENIKNHDFDLSRDLRNSLEMQSLKLAVAAGNIATDATMQKILQKGDSDRLLADWKPVYETLNRENNVTHFYFFDKTRTCLLRVHDPEKRGDLINRFTAIEAERTGKAASGIEMGPLGTFTLRLVKPVFEGGRLVGYVELGKEIVDVLLELQTRYQSHMAVIINKKHLNRQGWTEGMRMRGREAEWDRLSQNVVTYSTHGRLPEAFVPLVEGPIYGENSREVFFSGRDWRTFKIPLKDASGTEVGNLLVMHDVSTEKAAFMHLLVLSGTAGMVLLAVLLGFIYILLRRTDTGIVTQQAELKESEKKYRMLFDSAGDAIFIHDEKERMLAVNSMACERLGYTHDELMSMVIGSIETTGQGIHASDRMVRLKAQGYCAFETVLKHKDGSHIPTEVNERLITWDGQRAMMFICRDITERRLVEKEKRNMEERLQRAEKMESLGLLAGGVAHDLNNVLGIVVGYAELLLMGADISSPIRSKLVNIMEGGQKAAMIVGDLLALARRGVSGREVLNLNKIIADWQQSPELEKMYSYHSGIKLKTDLDPDLLNISGSPVHLGKTLFNLVSNASEAMPKGGTLTIKTINQYVDKPIPGYDQIQAGDYVVLSVSDTGEGINEADLNRIFEPFYTKKVMGRSGTGLGLAVVWGTVKDHNGYINVQSEEGKGSTFTLYFPVAREELSSENIAVSISEYMGKGESILVIDDVKGQQNLAQEMLRKLNYSATSVSSGEEAVAYLKKHKADLLVLDMIMDPGMDGLDTYRSVLEIHPEQKAIIVSGFSESDRVKAVRALGAGAYVRKPYVIEKLGLAVRKELDRST